MSGDYGYDWRRRFDDTGFGYPMSNWNLIPEGWQGALGAGGGIPSAAPPAAAAAAVPGFGWGTFAAQQGLGLAGKTFSYMFGGQRKEQKEAKREYGQDRRRILGSMDESPYSLANINTFAVRGMHNYLSTVSKQMADIADVNALDVQGAMGEAAATEGQNKMLNSFITSRMARFDKRARDRYAVLQSSADRFRQAMMG